ncbi:MAG: NAD(P)-dependent oxidoreductase [Terracidiphilus sp.]
MNVVLFGATGKAGSRILKELLARGHQVTAVVRKPTTLPAGVTVKQDDLSNVDHTAKVIAGADAVVSAYGPPPDNTDLLIGATTRLVDAARKAGVPRLIVVGGAASLEVAPGVTLLASGQVPPEWLPIATSHAKVLEMMRTSDINWTYFSPAGYFEPGERTGKFRLGKDNLIMAANGQSRISMEDYAIALVDELEKPANERARFTIGY